jgi:hypothetical protein
MAAFGAYKSAQGWIITATVNGREMYFQNVLNGEYKFTKNTLFAKPLTAKTASKHLSDLLGMPFQVNERTEAKKAAVVKAIMEKGWDNDEAILIMERIFRQYESNVMGLSIQAMVKRQPTKAEWQNG